MWEGYYSSKKKVRQFYPHYSSFDINVFMSYLSNLVGKCCFCAETGKLIDSHVVPESVLISLCKWKAGRENDGKQYLFRTDIDDGSGVECKECTTQFKKLLCSTCEKKFNSIDNSAKGLWRDLEDNWNCSQTQDIEMKVAVSSMVARAMCISLPTVYHECCGCLIKAIESLKKDMYNKTIEKTKKRLDDIGFLWYRLPSDGHDYENRKYRVEFPFRCAVNILPLRVRILTVCAQVPPFFCLLPYKSEDKEQLRKYLKEIVKAVQEKLEEKLNSFIEDEKAKGGRGREKTNFTVWYEGIHTQNDGPGPVLVFDYLKTSQLCIVLYNNNNYPLIFCYLLFVFFSFLLLCRYRHV